jgi:hypothetical protein
MASPALYWNSILMGMIGVTPAELLPSAKTILQQKGLTNVTQSNVDVSGRTPNTHAAITFFKVEGDVRAVIMVAGTVGQEAKDVRAKLSAGLATLDTL